MRVSSPDLDRRTPAAIGRGHPHRRHPERRLYNYVELRSELEARGHQLTTTSDTEVIAHLYEEDAAGFVEKLRGMFAIAIWDASVKRLTLARDRPARSRCTGDSRMGV